MKLIIGNKNYSSWSLRGWLAAKQSGLSFEEITVPMFGKQWDALKSEDGGTQPSHGKVPILWDDEAVVWDSLAILEYLADKVGRDRFWPKDAVARGMARSMVAEMHSSYHALRGECPMNLRRPPAPHPASFAVSNACRADVARVGAIFAGCLDASGGPFLMGRFSAVDAFYAPVLSRIMTYQLLDSDAVRVFAAALDSLPAWQEWRRAALAETAVIPADEVG